MEKAYGFQSYQPIHRPQSSVHQESAERTASFRMIMIIDILLAHADPVWDMIYVIVGTGSASAAGYKPRESTFSVLLVSRASQEGGGGIKCNGAVVIDMTVVLLIHECVHPKDCINYFPVTPRIAIYTDNLVLDDPIAISVDRMYGLVAQYSRLAKHSSSSRQSMGKLGSQQRRHSLRSGPLIDRAMKQKQNRQRVRGRKTK